MPESLGRTVISSATNLFSRAVLSFRESMSPDFGPEVVTNGDFSSATGWTGDGANGWLITGGKLTNTGAASTTSITQTAANQGTPLEIGKTYRTTIDTDAIPAGQYRIFVGVGSPLSFISGTGSFSEDIVCSGDTTIYIQPAVGLQMTADNLSIKEVL